SPVNSSWRIERDTMPSAPQPPKRSWRDDASSGRSGTNKREWQKEPGKSKSGPRFSKRAKLFAAAVALLAIVGGVVGLVIIVRTPPPPELVIIEAGYETNLAVPHNVYGKRGAGAFKKWAIDYNRAHGGKDDEPIKMNAQELTKEGDSFAEAFKPWHDRLWMIGRQRTAIVYVAVHGGADSQGAYLIPNNVSPKDGDVFYSIDKALAALEGLGDRTRKLLILDTTQLDADWDLGLLHNDLVRMLENN